MAASTTELSIDIGNVTLVTQPGLAYLAGARVRIASVVNINNWLEGLVTCYSGINLTVNVDSINGSGTYNDWNIGLTGQPGTNAAISFKIGWFRCPAVIGNYVVNNVGFKPKGVKFTVLRSGLQNEIEFCTGAMDSFGNQESFTLAVQFPRPTSRSNCYGNLAVSVIDPFGDPQILAGYVSMDLDGFTLNFIMVNTDFVIGWEAIG